ncbi:hypothetical protein G4D42_25100 [Burkholderia pseudomallei]|uniref:hypothetical protein n=1 Tax=Burkholderia pseudomallei TaxID=28450 RepID=UPI0012AEC3B4|nr:hypothetical protein [Burkholderia pseudomallei]NVI26462.1 hypothetical protein [Burkholderia pseudomallei]
MPDSRQPKMRYGEYLSLFLDKSQKAEIALSASDAGHLPQGSADPREQFDLFLCIFFSHAPRYFSQTIFNRHFYDMRLLVQHSHS